MTDDTVTSVDTDDNLDNFETEFFSTAKVEVDDKVEKEETADLGEDDLPAAEDEPDSESEPESESESESESDAEPEEEEAEEEEEEVEDKPRKNKVPFNKRIEQLNKQLRETERKYESRISELEAAIKEKASSEQPELREQLPANAPNPDAVDEKGEALYPLGEFDPKYIADLTQFTIDERMKLAEEKRLKDEQERQIEAQRNELASKWQERLDAVEEEIPDIRDNITELADTFQGLEPNYGEYLAATIMSMDNGPLIMNYLSQNIGEAQKIVNLGPALAAVALGRLDAVLAPVEREQKKEKRVSKAPPPPEDRTRGKGGQFSVRPDTDNLDAFEKEFYS